MTAELLAGLRDELERVESDIERHRDKSRVVDVDQWFAHLRRLQRSRRDLQERIREAA